MAEAQHLIERGPDDYLMRPICGSDDAPVETISPAEFAEQLGMATGQATYFEDFETPPPAICALCATRFVEKQRSAIG